jgi:PAS domain-containing protein
MNKKKVFTFGIIVAVVLLIGAIYFLGKTSKFVLLEEQVNDARIVANSYFKTFESQDTKALAATLDSILQDPGFKKVFLKQNREELNQYGQVLFQKLKAGYGITHFYFHLPSGETFLRLHSPNTFGDINNRITFKKAVESNEVGSGIELGKTAFALRVVKPYYDGDKLIGYIELGQEIDHFLKVLKQETNNDYAIYVKKENLNPADWAALRKNIGKDNNWDSFSKIVMTNSTFNLEYTGGKNLFLCFNETNAESFLLSDLDEKSTIDLETKRACSGFPLIDASGKVAGVVLLDYDLSASITLIDQYINKMWLVVLLIIILAVLISVYVSRKSFQIEKKYKYLFDSSNDAIMAINPPDWKYSAGNLATLRMFGVESVHELERLTPGVLSPERQPDGKLSSEKALEMINIAMDKGSNNFEWVHKKFNGPEFLTNVSLSKIGVGANAYLQVILRDITKEKVAVQMIKNSEEQVKKALAESERLNKLMVDRELKMIQLKKEKQDLEEKIIK